MKAQPTVQPRYIVIAITTTEFHIHTVRYIYL